MIFPAKMGDMLRGGYVFLQTQDCGDCRRLVYLFRTPRRRSVGPFVKTPRGLFVSHFAVCAPTRSRHAAVSCPGQFELFAPEVVSSLGP